MSSEKKAIRAASYATAASSGHGMKWHLFLIYFALWASALQSIFISGAHIITGSYWGESAGRVYSLFPSLKAVDIIFGALHIAVGILFIVVRFSLANFKETAPQGIFFVRLIQSLVQPVYVAFVAGIVDLPFSSLTGPFFSVGVIAPLVLAAFEYVYYKKRQYLFTH